MFSIRDARSRPIALGGRVLPQLADDRTAKYINSPETPLFSKSRELYGLDMARENFKAGGGAVVMEGYTDVLMAHQNGIDNCVAVLGTALGEAHLRKLRPYTENVTLVIDGDAAGQRRTNEIIDALLALFEKNQVNLRILTLPEVLDPCDIIATHGSDPFRALLAQAVDALEHKFKTVTNGLDTLTDTHRTAQAAEHLLATLASIRPSSGATSEAIVREDQMLSRIARQFHLAEETLRTRLTAIRRSARPRGAASRPVVADPAVTRATPRLADLPTFDRGVLELVLLDPSLIARLRPAVESASLMSDAGQRIYAACCRLVEDGWQNDFGRLLAEFDDPAMKNLLVQLDESCQNKASTDRERWLADLLELNERRSKEAADRKRLAAARQSDDNAEQLLAQFREQARSKHLSEYERRKK
jgi:DNA primase